MIVFTMKYTGTVYIVYDGQAGDCGKGKFTGLFAHLKDISISINNNTAGADHTFVFDNGKRVTTSNLPIAVVSPKVEYLVIGAGASINPTQLNIEIDTYMDLLRQRKIYVHKRAAIVLPSHISTEQNEIKSGSTFKGSGAAFADKILRKPGVILAGNYKDWHPRVELIDDSFIESVLNGEKSFSGGENILIETSQGFDLDINHGLEYPYVTSHQCTPAQALADCGLPHNIKTETYMLIRPYPIRISNDSNQGCIYSGNYGESKEITWDEIEILSGIKNLAKKEKTPDTNATRRVFEFNETRFKRAISLTNPNYVILNFAQYLGKDLNKFIEKLKKQFNVNIAYIGTGEKFSDYLKVDISKALM